MRLSTKIIGSIVFVCFVIVIVVSGAVFFLSRASLQRLVSEHQSVLAQQAIQTIDRLLYERFEDVQVVSSIVEHAVFQKEEIESAFNRLQFLSGPWDRLLYVDTSGKVFASTEPTDVSLTLEEEARNLFSQALAGRPGYSDYVVSVRTKKPTILFAAPVRDRANASLPVRGVVIGYLSWPIIEEIIREVRGFTTRLYTQSGGLIAGVREGASQPKKIGESYIQSTRHGTVLKSSVRSSGYLGYKGSEWFLTLESPTAISFAEAQRSAIFLSLVLVPVIILGMTIMSLLLQKVIIHPLSSLSKSTKAVMSGDFSQRVDIKTKDEIGLLATSYNDMMQKIQQFHLELEEKVRERTAELSKVKTGLEQAVQERTKELETARKQLESVNVDLESKVRDRTEELEKVKKSLEQLVVERTQKLEEKLREVEELNKAMIGRELRMIELKDQLEKETKKSA